MACDAICDHLQATSEGRIGDLLINVPPGTAKSLLTCVFWPAWVWIDHPETRWVFSSYRAALAVRDSVKCRALIKSDWYQQRWSDRFELRDDQDEKTKFENDRTGYRVIATIGAGTGERGDFVIVDDAHSVDGAESDTERNTAVNWWRGSMSTRLNSFATGHRIAIGQRLHEADLYGELIADGGYVHLCLAEEFDPEARCVTSIGWSDPRTERGELLWPQHRTREHVAKLKVTLGSYRYHGQYQQSPRPAGGNLFKNWWWKYWKPAGMNLPPVTVRNAEGEERKVYAVDLPETFDEQILSWDLAFKDTKSSDFVAGGAWASKGGDRFLLDQVCERMNFPKTVEALKAMSAKWPLAHRKLVEDKANGPAVISLLAHEVTGIIAVNPEGGKVSRAHAVSAIVEAGNVYLPHPMIAPWVESYLAELSMFPAGKHDDQVDQTTQALNRMNIGCRFGLIDYMIELQKAEEVEEVDARMQATAARLTATYSVTTSGVQRPEGARSGEGCPACQALCISLVTSGGLRCAQCGEQWGSRLAVRSGANRANLQEGWLASFLSSTK